MLFELLTSHFLLSEYKKGNWVKLVIYHLFLFAHMHTHTHTHTHTIWYHMAPSSGCMRNLFVKFVELIKTSINRRWK